MSNSHSFFVVGGAGFIGSAFVDRLLAMSGVDRVTVFDNFSSGREWHLDGHRDDARLQVVRDDATRLDALTTAMRGHDVVIHLASNPDIAMAMTDPTVDFDDGTLLTHNVVEAMRRSGTSKVLYASGSGVYGEVGGLEVDEQYGPCIPISTYGASKLAGEALIAAYSHMFDISGYAFRFGNVVGPRQTHGVGHDFVRHLIHEPRRLRILGDGQQSKSYIDVEDVIDAVLLVLLKELQPFRVFNVATSDYVSVREIADLAVECLHLSEVDYEFTGGDRGWKGDVPVVRLNTGRIRALGWRSKLGSREALQRSMEAMAPLAHAGRL
jgi:UDP-glucose 4-epimerase